MRARSSAYRMAKRGRKSATIGGMKMSGTARELGEEGLDSFCETKHVHWDMSAEAKEWWYPYGRQRMADGV